jgi:hypothetical protein
MMMTDVLRKRKKKGSMSERKIRKKGNMSRHVRDGKKDTFEVNGARKWSKVEE